jgi:hypothetical protein
MIEPAKNVVNTLLENKEVRLSDLKSSLLDRCATNIDHMVSHGFVSTELTIIEEYVAVVGDVVEQLRELGYRSCLVEVQNEHAVVLTRLLRVSMQHLTGSR